MQVYASHICGIVLKKYSLFSLFRLFVLIAIAIDAALLFQKELAKRVRSYICAVAGKFSGAQENLSK
jgi:hypothetical protein